MAGSLFKRVFVANRGEIAVRIVRACQSLGIETVVAVSEPDRASLAARLATRAVCIGPAKSSESYLNKNVLLHAALKTECDALHPGYGFLSERADFAQACEDAGICFIGPTPDAIENMGDKSNARAIAAAAGVPIVPGCDLLEDAEHAAAIGEQTGFPVLLKARAGGGGRGMRVVESPSELKDAFHSASAEAMAAFGNGAIYLERFIRRGRHVEVQVLGDGNGKVIHLFERDCSTQRRHQKLIEEAPSPRLAAETREAMYAAAVQLAVAVKYRGAGTVEFIVDDDTEAFYFLEMNTRIQVEHPVTEMLTGIDLVEQQIRIAATGELAIDQSDVNAEGHVIECRINAEDPDNGFMPSPGRITEWSPPTGLGIRLDTHCEQGSMVLPFYDSLIAKLIVKGANRTDAISRMVDSLSEFELGGIRTTRAFHMQTLSHPDFAGGAVTTRWVESQGID